jgi:signal transduction histidine kinase
MALSSALSLEQVLQVLVDVARELVGARYAALGVVNAERSGLSDFITSGLTPQQRARMGDLPTGHGILGLLVRDARPIRLKDLRDHPVSAGVPPHHPPMRSFLGVPVLAKGRVFGNLYLTEKVGAEEFTDDDMALTETLAIQAAIAIDNAQLRRERDRFFAAASHELGNALAAVRLWSGHLLRTTPESREEWVDGVSKIRGSAELAHRLIQDLLSLSRIQEGRLTLSAWPADMRDLVEDVIEQFGAEAEECAVVLEAELPDAELPIETDATRVRQILMNLLSNAIKVSSSGGRVHVGVEATPVGGAHAWVRDEGPGIAPADMERIFQPFEQVEVVARGRGAGLGLALSRQLARLLGGDLTADSAPGAGATFHLRLPRVLPAAAGGD